MDIQDFRTQFPAFDDPAAFRDEMLQLWDDAASLHLAEGWMLGGPQYELAHKLMTAHLVHLASVANRGGSGSTAGGAVQSASEGSVSVSFTTPPTKTAWQFWLSSSPYGLQLWAMLTIAGSGGVYIGGLPEREAFRKVGGVWA